MSQSHVPYRLAILLNVGLFPTVNCSLNILLVHFLRNQIEHCTPCMLDVGLALPRIPSVFWVIRLLVRIEICTLYDCFFYFNSWDVSPTCINLLPSVYLFHHRTLCSKSDSNRYDISIEGF